GGGLGGLVVLLLVGYCLGVDPSALLQTGTELAPSPGTGAAPPPSDEAADFIAAVLGSTEDVWTEIFGRRGARYPLPTLVLFDGSVASACGFSTAATGPFYCPPDQRVYLDLGFFRELAQMGGPGDFAAAYVVGHEVGHHVQNVLGTADRVRDNASSVLLELQADCYAGVWAHHANRRSAVLEPGDVEEGLGAAQAIGDDRLQGRAGQTVSPESFTHGTSAQRAHWLRTGIERGSVQACDTFGRGR
ncbi:MAG: KPN_02809 family neutral zinc metallopeptidase, partial [Acidimicrobiales bacterium]